LRAFIKKERLQQKTPIKKTIFIKIKLVRVLRIHLQDNNV
jgi:hypothetical protein